MLAPNISLMNSEPNKAPPGSTVTLPSDEPLTSCEPNDYLSGSAAMLPPDHQPLSFESHGAPPGSTAMSQPGITSRSPTVTESSKPRKSETEGKGNKTGFWSFGKSADKTHQKNDQQRSSRPSSCHDQRRIPSLGDHQSRSRSRGGK